MRAWGGVGAAPLISVGGKMLTVFFAEKKSWLRAWGDVGAAPRISVGEKICVFAETKSWVRALGGDFWGLED